jgi:AraC-like DNA-binding protein
MAESRFHYLPVNDLTMQCGNYVTSVGHVAIPTGKMYPPPGHPALYQFDWGRGRTLPEFAILLITAGRGTFESLPSGEVPVETNSVFLLFPGVWHRYRPDPKTGWTERWLCFNGEFIHRLVNLRIITPERAVWKIRCPVELIQSFDQLLEKIDTHPSQNSVLLSLYAMALLAKAMELAEGNWFSSVSDSSSEVLSSDDPLVAKTVEMIWAYSHRSLSVGQLSRQLRTARRTLDRRFREVLGRTVLEEINRCRLTRAKRLLLETVLPIKTIAYLAGFTDAERMRVVFLKQENVTPTAYRRLQQASGWKTLPAVGAVK